MVLVPIEDHSKRLINVPDPESIQLVDPDLLYSRSGSPSPFRPLKEVEGFLYVSRELSKPYIPLGMWGAMLNTTARLS